MKHPASPLITQAQAVGVTLSQEAAERLVAFEMLLLDRAVPAGIIGRTDAGRIRSRHILDCLRAAGALEPSDRQAYDLGTGGGLPGLVLAIAAPGLRITLVDVRRRKGAFAEMAIERLAIENATVVIGRIEDLVEPVDVCFARALAPLPDAWRLAEPVLRPAGRLVYFAGARSAEPFEVPGARCLRTLRTPVLERSGPLVIMAR